MLGFELRADEAHEQVIDPEDTDTELFFEVAEALLDKATPAVQTEVIPELESYKGRWHPLGFMVYPLGVHPEIGSLRLHIWPITFRETIAGGSGIHNHAWNIASRVVAGEYTDARFQIDETTTLPADKTLPANWLRVFMPKKVAGEPDCLSSDGTIVSVRNEGEVRVSAGWNHRLVPEEFHLPTIPLTRLASTLVLDSPSFGYPPSILIGGTRGPESFHNARPIISVVEARAAKEQILASQDSY